MIPSADITCQNIFNGAIDSAWSWEMLSVSHQVTLGRPLPFDKLGFFNTVKYGGEDNLTLFSRQTPPVSGKNAEKHL